MCPGGVGWLPHPPCQDGAMPPMPTTRAPSVLGMCGWVSAPRTSLPRVYRSLVHSLGVSARPCRVIRRTTMPRVSPQSLSTHPTSLRARREDAGRPHGPYPPPTDPRSPHRATPLSHKRSLHPCTPPSQWAVVPRPTPQPPLLDGRHDDAREVHAGRPWGGRTVRCDCPRSGGHRLGVVCLVAQYCAQYPVLTPLSNIPAARARAAVLRPLALVVPSERPWATQRPRSGGVRAPWTVEGRAVRSSAPAGT